MAVGGLDYVTSPAGVVVSINYTLVVPLLLAAYMFLLRVADDFLDPKKLRELGLDSGWTGHRPPSVNGAAEGPAHAAGDVEVRTPPPPPSNARRHGWSVTALIPLALYIQHLAIDAAAKIDMPSRPWTDADGSLNFIGALYYAMRGINCMVALGLTLCFLLLITKLLFRLRDKTPEDLYTSALRVKLELRRLGAALAIAFFAASAAIAIHGLGFKLENPAVPNGELAGKEVAAIWAFWAALAAPALLGLLAAFIRLHVLLTRGPDSLLARAITSVETDSETATATWQAKEAIIDVFGRANTWPLPRVLVSAALVISALLQLLGLYLKG